MNLRAKKRLLKIIFLIIIVTSGIYIILYNLSDSISFYVTPSDMFEKNMKDKIRLGGFVVPGSVNKKSDSHILFELSDEKYKVLVEYNGFIPIIFRDNQGVIVYGNMVDKKFVAEKLLAKHDERYIPKKIKEENL